MKKRERALLKCLEHQQTISLKLIEVLKAAYDTGTAEDSAPAGAIKKPDIHKGIEPVRADELLRHFQ
jgi:hypothetical protein